MKVNSKQRVMRLRLELEGLLAPYLPLLRGKSRQEMVLKALPMLVERIATAPVHGVSTSEWVLPETPFGPPGPSPEEKLVTALNKIKPNDTKDLLQELQCWAETRSYYKGLLAWDEVRYELGGDDKDGHVYLYPAKTAHGDRDHAVAHLYARQGPCNMRWGVLALESGRIVLSHGGHIEMTSKSEYGPTRGIQLRGDSSQMRLGGGIHGGEVLVFSSETDLTLDGTPSSRLGSGTLDLGGQGSTARIRLFPANAANWAGPPSVLVDGEAGDIVLANGDCAEEFSVHRDDEAEPGCVLVIGAEDRLEISRCSYDRRVAGVVSGAMSTRPGIVLGRSACGKGRLPIALVGKVYCNVDADPGQINVGDLLTTSERPGHAMRAFDRDKAFGAVVGKALAALKRGQGQIPILVGLQ